MEVRSCNLRVGMQKEKKNILIESDSNIFGVQPFFCLKLYGGSYVWSNLDFIGDYKWSFTFDKDSVEMKLIEKIGIAIFTHGLQRITKFKFYFGILF